MDKRYQIMKERLASLTLEELNRIKSDIDQVCFDTYNYDVEHNTYCPLAVALNLHNSVKNPTNDLVIDILGERFSPVNAVGGVEGQFYITDRKQDLLNLVDELLYEKQEV